VTATIRVTYSIDGKCPHSIASVLNAWMGSVGCVLLSEDFDGTKDWAVEIDKFEVEA